MPKIYNHDTSEVLGEINEEQLEILMELLEEESEDDDNYYIDTATLDYLEQNGVDEELLAMLQKALGEEEGIEIRIEDEEAAAAG
ncbi:MAG: galactosyldiacylglycerol synthase [Acidobacteriota bacterium]